MNNLNHSYRMLSDEEPGENELKALMHEVAIDVKNKSDIALQILRKKIKREISEALVREGC